MVSQVMPTMVAVPRASERRKRTPRQPSRIPGTLTPGMTPVREAELLKREFHEVVLRRFTRKVVSCGEVQP
jgi:hypothetical protein